MSADAAETEIEIDGLRERLIEARRLAASGRIAEAKRCTDEILDAQLRSTRSMAAIASAAASLAASLDRQLQLKQNRIRIIGIVALSGIALIILSSWKAPVEIDGDLHVQEVRV